MKLDDKGRLILQPGEAITVILKEQIINNPADVDYWTTSHELECLLRTTDDGRLVIAPKGYGSYAAVDEHAAVATLEKDEDIVVMRCWSNINSNDPTHTVNFAKALEYLLTS